MCVGLARQERLIRSAAAGVGNLRRAAGRAHRPRRDRRRLGAGERRAVGGGRLQAALRVQIGDPFEESKLVECCLELLERETLASLQDLGAAGLSSSSSEMASKGEVGLDIDVARVPLREADMEPFEIMISESQERMLCVVEPARLGRAAARSASAGTCAPPRSASVTDTRRLRVFDGDELVGDMPVEALVDDCPLYDLEPSPPAGSRSTRRRAARLAPGRGRRARRCWRCSPRPTWPRSASSSSSTTRSSGSRTVRRPQAAPTRRC